MKQFVEKATLGRNQLAASSDNHYAHDEVRRLEQDLLAHRTRPPSAAERTAKLDELISVLTKCDTAKSKGLRRRVRFACWCVDVIKRRVGTGKEKEYQRRKERRLIALNNIVSELAPWLGAYALAFFLVADTANYSYYVLAKRNADRRQKCVRQAAQELLKMEIRVRRDQLWFHPGALISWFLGDGYSKICEALGLGVFADPYLDRQGMGFDVPWASHLGPLFARKPARDGRIGGDDQHAVLNPQVHARQGEAPLDPDVSVNLPRKRLRMYGPDFGMSHDVDHMLAFRGTPNSAFS